MRGHCCWPWPPASECSCTPFVCVYIAGSMLRIWLAVVVQMLTATLTLTVSPASLHALTEKLLHKDINSAVAHMHVNYQSRVWHGNTVDNSPMPLLSLSTNALNLPTVAALRRLHDNYVADTMTAEHETEQELREQEALLDAILGTPVMREAMVFLADHGLVKRDSKAYKQLLRHLWFSQYSRGHRRVGSSAFEHVFLGEVKGAQVSGLHNWVFFSKEEAARTADYMGYMRKVDLAGHGAIAKVQYKWHGLIKPSSTMFLGTSPELEMALYTVCFLVHPDKRCDVRLGGKAIGIRTHTFTYNGKKLIGSAFPEI